MGHLKNGVNAFQWSPDGSASSRSGTGPSDAVAPKRAQERRSPLQNISLQVQRHGLVRRQAHSSMGDRCATGARIGSSLPETIGTTPIRNGRPTVRASRLFPTAPAASTTGGFNKDVWVIRPTAAPLTKISDHDFEDTRRAGRPTASRSCSPARPRGGSSRSSTSRRRRAARPRAGSRGISTSSPRPALGAPARTSAVSTGYKGTTHALPRRLTPAKSRRLRAARRFPRFRHQREGRNDDLPRERRFQRLDDLYAAASTAKASAS
jgi:hypothetical protein